MIAICKDEWRILAFSHSPTRFMKDFAPSFSFDTRLFAARRTTENRQVGKGKMGSGNVWSVFGVEVG